MNTKNVGIVTIPIAKSGIVPLSNLVEVLYPLYKDVYLITGNEGYAFFKMDNRIHIYGIKHERGENMVTRILKFISTQLKISYQLARITEKVDLWIFFFGGDCLLLPMLTARLFKKPVILAFAGSAIQSLKSTNGNLYKPLGILSKINCTLSNKIILYSPNFIRIWNLEKYRNKISIAHRHFLDFDKFKIKRKFNERGNLVGYIGRFNEEKGVLNFVKAIPEVLKERSEIEFLMGGDGTLRDGIEKYLDENDSKSKVKFAGWIPHDKLPKYLNELKLVVLPSYTEGLPNVMLEAMACGTPVLATPIGAIPDVIKDGRTGFIMENNSPECIAKNVIRTLEHPDLEEIVKSARELAEREFTYEAAVEGYRKILKNVQSI